MKMLICTRSYNGNYMSEDVRYIIRMYRYSTHCAMIVHRMGADCVEIQHAVYTGAEKYIAKKFAEY